VGRGIDSLLRWLTRSGMRRAMSGEHWAWFAVGGAAFFLRRARRRDHGAARIHLRSGDRYVIEVHDGAGRGSGRGLRRQGDQPGGRGGPAPQVVWQGERITTSPDRSE
jgi:hypothetical protein